MRRGRLTAAGMIAGIVLLAGCGGTSNEPETAEIPATPTTRAIESVFPTATTGQASIFFEPTEDAGAGDEGDNSFLPIPTQPTDDTTDTPVDETDDPTGEQDPGENEDPTNTISGNLLEDETEPEPEPEPPVTSEEPEENDEGDEDGATLIEVRETDGDGSMADECDDPTGFASLFGECDDPSTDTADSGPSDEEPTDGEPIQANSALEELDLFSDRGGEEAALRSLHFLVYEQDPDFGTRAAQAAAYVLQQAHPDLSVENRELEKWFWLMCNDYIAPQDGSEAPYSLYGDGAGVIDLILEHNGEEGRDGAVIAEDQEPFYVAMTLYAAYLVCPEAVDDAYSYSPTLLRARLSAMSTPGYGVDYSPAAQVLEQLEDPPLSTAEASDQAQSVTSGNLNDLWASFFAEE